MSGNKKGMRGRKASASPNLLDIPDGVPVGLWDMLLSIKSDTAATSIRVDQLEERVVTLEEEQTTQTDLTTMMEAITKRVEVLTARMDKQDARCEHIVDSLDDLRAYSMKENLRFNFDYDVADYREAGRGAEDSVAIIKAFLKNVMGIDQDVYIPVAHRIGRRTPNTTRPIIVKVPVAKERDLIMKNTIRLRNTRHFITTQLTTKQRERKDFVLPVFKALKANDETVKLRNDKLYVKGDLQHKYLKPILPSPTNQDPSLELTKGGQISDKGSVFSGFVANVTSLQAVSDVINLARNSPQMAAATHLIYAYRVGDKDVKQNFDSDGDYGVGLTLLTQMQERKMNNMIWIVTRNCDPGYSQLGKRRMDHAVAVCLKAMDSSSSI